MGFINFEGFKHHNNAEKTASRILIQKME